MIQRPVAPPTGDGFRYLVCDQGSAEWHQARAGVITASMFGTIMDTPKRGNERYNAAARKYAADKAIERISGKPLSDEMGEGFKTWQMRRGNEKEPLARAEYIAHIGNDVTEAGFCMSMDGKFGASADGFIAPDGTCEIKCFVASEKLLRIWLENDVEDVMPQIQGQLWLSGRRWCDFCLYAPQLANVGKTLYVQRVMRDDEYIGILELALLEFDGFVDEQVVAMRGAS